MARRTMPTILVFGVGIATLVSACGIASSDSRPSDPRVRVTGVERVFITRPFGGPLPANLVYLEFDPAVPSAVAYRAIGSGGDTYNGASPAESKICGFPEYLGHRPSAGQEGATRTIAFIVPDSVRLEELQWSRSAEDPGVSISLPDATLVCTPPVGSSATVTGSQTRAV